jgi:aspartyl-tRNA(Asn)/glutamyl-tRNA(Gln) amidotransferase subunit A
MTLQTANQNLKAFIDVTNDPLSTIIGPLAGMRIGIKANIAVKGLANTAGSGARRHAIAAQDADVVKLLRQAGATIVGTLNMHEGALGATTDNKAYGRCINPWRDGFSPGGSSGGSGAAIAAGLVDSAMGSDTMGSIRLPASYCGVFGYKPAGAMVSQDGVVPLSTTLDQVGPLAKDAPTLWAMAQALGCPAPLTDLRGQKFGVPRDMTAASPEIAALFEASLEKLRQAGATLVDVTLGIGVNAAMALSDVDVILAALLVCEVEGAREWAAELSDPTSDITDEFRAMLTYGANIGAVRIDDAYAKLAFVKAHIRTLMYEQGFAGLIMPTVSHLAFHHDVGPPMDQAYYTQYANIADLPAVSAPMGLIDGLPAGIMCMAAPDCDDVALGFAGLFPALVLPLVE